MHGVRQLLDGQLAAHGQGRLVDQLGAAANAVEPEPSITMSWQSVMESNPS